MVINSNPGSHCLCAGSDSFLSQLLSSCFTVARCFVFSNKAGIVYRTKNSGKS